MIGPREKIKIVFDVDEPAPEPPPIACALCDTEHPAWHYTPIVLGEHQPICLTCSCAGIRRTASGLYGWGIDHYAVARAHGAIKALEGEIGRAARTR